MNNRIENIDDENFENVSSDTLKGGDVPVSETKQEVSEESQPELSLDLSLGKEIPEEPPEEYQEMSREELSGEQHEEFQNELPEDFPEESRGEPQGEFQEELQEEVPVQPVQEPEPKERAGTILKRERERQNISLEIVHEATKIPLDALRAIEEDYTIRMLSPFYYSGFVKMYADYLHIDVSQVLTDYKQEKLPKHIAPKVEEFEVPKWIGKIFTRERKQQMVIATGVVLAIFVVTKIGGFLMSRKPADPVEKRIEKPKKVNKVREVKKVQAAKVEAKRISQKPKVEIKKEAPKIIAPKITPRVTTSVPRLVRPAAKPAVSIAPVKVLQKDVNLTVRANQNSWLRVKVDGDVVFQSTLRRGAVETWYADKDIEISGRNISQLEFELNGKMIGTLGRKDRNANNVIVTKSGLSVK